MGEGIMGGCQEWLRGPWGVVRVGELTKGGHQGLVRGGLVCCQEQERGP